VIPILRLQNLLVVTVPSAVSDDEFAELAHELTVRAGTQRVHGVVVDVSAIDVLDSFACRMLQSISQTVQLRGARTVVVGIQPDVAFAMVQLGLTLDGVTTAHDLDDGMVHAAASEPA
jgi:rsbT antagonist protein RsbS